MNFNQHSTASNVFHHSNTPADTQHPGTNNNNVIRIHSPNKQRINYTRSALLLVLIASLFILDLLLAQSSSQYSNLLRDNWAILLVTFSGALFAAYSYMYLLQARKLISRLKNQKNCLLDLAKSRAVLGGDVFSAAKEICFQGVKVLEASRCSIWTFSEDHQEASCLVMYDSPSKEFYQNFTLNRSQCPVSFEKLLHQKVCSFSRSKSTDAFFRELRMLSGLPVTRALSATVLLDGKLCAVISVLSCGSSRSWEPDEENFSASLADLFSISINEQRHKALVEESQLKSLAIDSAMDGIGVLNSDGRFTLLNKSLLKNFGYNSENELLFHSWKTLFPEFEIRRFDEYLNARFRKDGKLLVETVGLRKDGSTFPQELSLTSLDSERWVVVSRDISKRKKVERNAEQIALFATLDPSPVIRLAKDGRILIANPSAIELLQLSYNGNEFIQTLIPQFKDISIESLIKSGGVRYISAVFGNSTFRITIKGIPYLDCVHIYASEVTDLKEREKQLENSKQLLQDVLNANPNLILLKDKEGRIKLINDAAAALFNKPVHELIGRYNSDFLSDPRAIARMKAEDSEVLTRKKKMLMLEDTFVGDDKKTRWLQTMKMPINIDGEPHVLGVATDITEQKSLREQVIQSSKLEALGQLAGGIAHDFNNLLTAVFGYTNLLKALRSSDSEVVEAADMIERAARRASELTEKLLGFARKGKQRNVPVNIHEILEELYSLVRRTFENSIQIEVCFCPEPTIIPGDPTQMHQVFLNLALNARDAMKQDENLIEKEGRILIQTEIITHSELSSELQLTLRGERYVRIDVSDTGCGMDSETQLRLFEPFFTTKEPGKGTGMGLAMVYGIIQSHMGAIEVSSQENVGSTFSVYLPLAHMSEIHSPKISTPEQEIIYGEGRVLLVEDHPLVRNVAERMLVSLGYEVTILGNGKTALDLYSKDPTAFDLVILDLIMPSMSASECYRHMSILNPRVRVLLSTGYVTSLEIEELLLRGVKGFVQKPYQLVDFSQAVARAMGKKIDRNRLRQPLPSKALN